MVDVLQEILQRHTDGINFREWNAGYAIDSKMRDAGIHTNS